jgi:hypothetical protein
VNEKELIGVAKIRELRESAKSEVRTKKPPEGGSILFR